MLGTQPEYRAMIAADIEGSAGRGNVALMTVRNILFDALRDTSAASGIDWDACHRSDRGDGMVLVGPRDMQKSRFIYPFVNDLAERLRAHNRTAGEPVRIRVRMAAHAGDIYVHDGTVAGSPFEFLARMLDAPPVKDGLAAAPVSTTVGLVVSQHIYDEVIRHGYVGIAPESFSRVEFSVKETTAAAWVQLPVAVPVNPGGKPSAAASGSTTWTQKNYSRKGNVFGVQGGTQNVYTQES